MKTTKQDFLSKRRERAFFKISQKLVIDIVIRIANTFAIQQKNNTDRIITDNRIITNQQTEQLKEFLESQNKELKGVIQGLESELSGVRKKLEDFHNKEKQLEEARSRRLLANKLVLTNLFTMRLFVFG